ncbi:hypothetical protein JZO81_19415 [Enterococcus hulanensis]|uniref:hypothetical protein n=1 Tax=Enterococcus TaxID=1350 RepID=UPI000B71DD9C|nr:MULTISPECIES: hypothetical protein [Enterococcus]MBO0413230.1 hypothetical protein [Enterococcus hulanensis]OTO15103.1 hypothetical protein A5875_004260 [Enterococcus sp. 3H8_DIV0648]
MYEPAVEAGIPADKYWSMTLEEIIVQATANKKVREREMKEKAIMDYKLARLNAYSFNDPKNTPAIEKVYDFFEDTQSNENLDGSVANGAQVSAEDKKWMAQKANMMQLAAAIKRTNAKKKEGG